MPTPKASLADWFAAGCTIAVIIISRFLDRGAIDLLRIIGGIAGLAGALLAFVPMFTLRKYGRAETGKNYMHSTIVVDRGIFAVIRHPQYLGYMLFNLCFMLLTQHWVIYLLGPAAIMFFYLFARIEDRCLLEKFGPAYREYMHRVPAFNIFVGIMRALK